MVGPGAEPRPQPLSEMPDTVNEVLDALDQHKGRDPVVLDMREISGFTDFMVICTGRSEPHSKALADAVVERLASQGVKTSHIEGRAESKWILLDYLDLVVHVFTPETRRFYQLEKLWREAPMLEWHPGEAEPDA